MALLGNKNVGDIVKIKENGEAVNYIIVHKGLPGDIYDASCDGVWVLRETIHSCRGWEEGVSSSDRDTNRYSQSSIHSWLNSTFLNTIDADIRTSIKTVRIPYVYYETSVEDGASGLSCKVFLLSAYEVNCTVYNGTNMPIDGAKLDYFSDNASRIGKDSSGEKLNWWLRTSHDGTYDNRTHFIAPTGYLNQEDVFLEYGARPAFVLPPTLSVNPEGIVALNIRPTITSDMVSGSDPGEVSEPINFAYTVNDEDVDDIDKVTVTEYLDDVPTRTYKATLGAENTFEAVSDPLQFQKILNGQHTLKIIANDIMDDSEPYTVTFDKQVKTAVISLANPLPADDAIRAAVINVVGKIPYDAELEVLVTNNALDENPVWENMTQDFEKKINHVFTNSTAANGFAFNFKVTATRGARGEQGFIEKIGGAFE